MSESSELTGVLDEFCDAFQAQDVKRLRDVFAEDEVSFVASEDLVLHDRGELERFFDAYASQPTSFSFGWDSTQAAVAGDSGWITAFGHEIAHSGQGDQSYPFRMTLVCLRSEQGWRIAHVHASTPFG